MVRSRAAPVGFDDKARPLGRKLPHVAKGYQPRRAKPGRTKGAEIVDVGLQRVISLKEAKRLYHKRFVTPYENPRNPRIGVPKKWTTHEVDHRKERNVLVLRDIETGQVRSPFFGPHFAAASDQLAPAWQVIARLISKGLARQKVLTLQRLAKIAPNLVTTDFASKRSSSGKARGKILHIGVRRRRRQWGPYAHKPSAAAMHRQLFAEGRRLAAAMVAADAQHNQDELARARAAVGALRAALRNQGLELPFLNDAYNVGVFGNSAGNPQHVDNNDLVGSLFCPLGTAPLMFALPEYEVYVQAQRGDILYLNTPQVLHGACVPPHGVATARMFAAARKEHLTFGLYCSKTVRNVRSD